MRAIGLTAVVLAGMLGGSALGVSPALAEGRMKEIGNTRDRRYCDVLAVDPAGATLFSTLGVSDCPPSAWQAFVPEAAASQLDARSVLTDGPRHYVMDWIQSQYLDRPLVEVQGLELRPMVQRKAGKAEDFDAARPYAPQEVPALGTYIYAAGETVYELLGPDRRVYVMVSYAKSVDPDLSIDRLAGLGEHLALPEGWRFRTRTLDQDLHLAASDTALVVVDDLHNRYQRFELNFRPT